MWRIGALPWIIATLLQGQAMHIVYPKFSSEKDTRYLEQVELLQTALAKTQREYGEFTLRQSTVLMNELRLVREVKRGVHINVIWTSTSPSLEKELLPIRIPISKGILGYRIFLIMRENEPKFSTVRTLEDLRRFRVGQGMDWGDVKVFEGNGLPVETGSGYEGLFRMLAEGRFDYFSRGINEAFKELEARKDAFPEMVVEKDLALYYPWPYYFFVSPRSPRIAERLEKGLNRMIADGSFTAIFLKYNKASIDKARLRSRRIIRLVNPLLPPKTPLDRKELWFTP